MRLRTRIYLMASVWLICILGVPLAGQASQAKYVILMIGDGMGPAHIGAAWLYRTHVLHQSLRMVEVMRAGSTGYMVNDAADGLLTESAAAAGQIATGQRMNRRTLSVSPDGSSPVQTILEFAKAKGRSVGLVTTSAITDATPAAFVAHLPDRSDEVAVAVQQLRAGVDVLFGGGRQFFLPAQAGGARLDRRNLLDEARAAGYGVVNDAKGLEQVLDEKVLGLFNLGTMAFEIDRPATHEPSLAAMTAKALQLLSRKSPQGFFVMVEGGRIDHAAHRNDAVTTILETLAFDDAVGIALDFQRAHPDTLLIVTADHETGGMAVMGPVDPPEGFLRAVQNTRASLEGFAPRLLGQASPDKVRDLFRKDLGIALSDEDARTIVRVIAQAAGSPSPVEAILAQLPIILRPYLGVGWATTGHTATPLFTFGVGPSAEQLRGFQHNTELFAIMQDALAP